MRAIAGNPYPGLRAFRQEDQDVFFGRTTDAATVADLWTANRLTILTGPPASGKTSLLLAGVYPLMPGRQSDVLPVGDLSHGLTVPLAALPEQDPYTMALLTSWAPAEVPTRFAGLAIGDFVSRLTRGRDRPLFASIDHLDDLVSDTGSASRTIRRRQFLADLARAFTEHRWLHLLIAARSEALDIIIDALGPGVRHIVRPLSVMAALDAVTKPAERAGRAFAEGTATALIDDLRTSRVTTPHGDRRLPEEHVEPALLQAVCHRLWDELPADVMNITQWDVREFGDVDTGLAAFCSRVVTEVAGEHDLTSKRLRTWLVKTFVTDKGTRGTAYEGPASTAEMPNAIARGLADRHLLASELKSSARWYQLLSDRLIEPLRHASDERTAVPAAGDFIRAAQRELALGHLDLAQRHAERALRTQPGLGARGHTESLLGNVAHERGNPADAYPHYREAASLLEAADDTSAAARALAAAGQCLLSIGRAREAVPDLRSAIERASFDSLPKVLLARALWELGESQTAIAILDEVLAIDGESPEALRARGEILADLGQARSALMDLGRLPAGNRAVTLAAHALALAGTGDHLRASQKMDDALAKAPWNGAVLLYAARAAALSNDMVSAGELARRAIDATDPPLSAAHLKAAASLARRP
jgi:tetratricopeptide (TPR) repeat protein